VLWKMATVLIVLWFFGAFVYHFNAFVHVALGLGLVLLVIEFIKPGSGQEYSAGQP
jgi:hypothetical protein